MQATPDRLRALLRDLADDDRRLLECRIVDGWRLDSIPVGLQRRVTGRQDGQEHLHLILGPHPVDQRSELHTHLPADALPILACGAELGWLRTLPAVRLRNADGGD